MIRYSRDKTYELAYEVYSSHANVFISLGYDDQEPTVKGLWPPRKDAEMLIANRVLLQSGIVEKCRTYHSLEYCICASLILTQHKTKKSTVGKAY